ncbi:MAG: DUF4272 domain-containing protein [Phycisphaerae bacterium]|nr:DUF4272 domain-containing protein [Phycisphaerae bacterium]
MSESFDNDLNDCEPPTATEVARRCLCLAAFIMRGQIEAAIADNRDVAEARQFAKRLAGFIDEVDMSEWFSPRESQLMTSALGEWKRQQQINATWRCEALTCLLWSLSKLEIPPYDKLAELDALAETVPLLRPIDEVREFLAWATLRESWEISDARDLAESWHWRARTHALSIGHYGDPPDPKFDEYAQKAAARMAEDHDMNLIDGDYPAFGVAYREVDDDQFSTLMSIAQERHYALNWLCWGAISWDDVETNT